MVLSGLGFTAMSATVKGLARAGVSQAELVFHRSWINFAIVLAIMLIRRERIIVSRGRLLLIGRGIAGFSGLSCLFYALTHLPLPIASLLNWCSPIFVLVFSRIFLREPIPPRTVPGLLVAFAGLGFLLLPGLGADTNPLVRLAPFAVGVGVLGAAFGGMAYVAVRAASARVTANTIVLYFTGTATLLAVPGVAWEGFHRHEGVLPRLFMLGTFATVGQLSMTRAYALAPAAQVSAMSLMNAVFSAATGWFFFGEALSLGSWFGALLTAAGVLLLTFASGGPRAGVKSPNRWAMLKPWS